jgi:TonB family protein
MKYLRASSLLLMAAFLWEVPVAAELLTLAPTGKWVVEFDDQQCIATRLFAAPGGDMAVAIRPAPTGGDFDVFIVPAKAPNRRIVAYSTITIGGRKLHQGTLWARPKPDGRLLYRLMIPSTEYANLVESRTMTLQGDLGYFTLDLAGLDAVARTLNDCNSDLLARWGLSREEQAKLASFPEATAKIDEIVSNRAYPSAAYPAAGDVVARVAVAADGSVSDCVVVGSSGNAALDKATCDAFVHLARMKPALERSGQPMRGVFVFTKRWLFPHR